MRELVLKRKNLFRSQASIAVPPLLWAILQAVKLNLETRNREHDLHLLLRSTYSFIYYATYARENAICQTQDFI